MKRLLILFVIILLTVTCGAQSKFGFIGGPQVTSSHYAINGKRQSNTFKYGIQLGINWKIPFENKLYFSPEIFYSLKGYKVKFNEHAYPPDATATDNSTMIHCVELAPLLQIDFGNEPGHFFFRGGPSFDLQLIGREKFHLQNGDFVKRPMKYGYAEYGHYAFNFIVQMGYESNTSFFFNVHYSYGLTNLSNVDGGPTIAHRVFGISIGEWINRKKIVMDTRNKE